MKQNYLIGLGGSGGKVIARLYNRLIEERGPGFASNVACIAIDTDQDELNKLAQLGVEKVCISGSETVGQLFNYLGEDVGEWCPNTANEGVFFSDPVFNGASQCRLKSRLCFANFLKNTNNTLAQALEESRIVSSTNETASDAPPRVLIVSSIAGGTGSGIFIQTALYIKKFFKAFNVQPKIYGLFACPDLYKKDVNSQQLPNLYANAYAVIRELNAFNLISGEEEISLDGARDIDIEISTSCEGRLFEKDAAGRYGDKPYDAMYFIDKVNSLSRILGGLDEYYVAMANIAYSLLYTDIAGEVLSGESNEMPARNKIPTAIYGSAGAAAIRYPYEDILKYFASRSIEESIGSDWSTLDKQWENYFRTKDATARASGRNGYIPEPGERADHYIHDFESAVKTTGVTTSPLSFLAPMVERDETPAADRLISVIVGKAQSAVGNEPRINKVKAECGLDDLDATRDDLTSLIDSRSLSDENADMFSSIAEIDEKLEIYCKHSLGFVLDMAIPFANEILCDDKALWETYDKSDCSVITNLLYNGETSEWVHPVAARYMLYSFMTKVNEQITSLIDGIDNPEQDDADDFYNYLIEDYVDPHRKALNTNDEESYPNAVILQRMVEKVLGKRNAKKGVATYFDLLSEQLEAIDEVLCNALLYFAFLNVRKKLAALIDEYELFFDNLDEFVKNAHASTLGYAHMHDNSRGDVYVCASAEIKEKLYEKAGRNINTQTGETASLISKALFDTMRDKAASRSSVTAKKISLKEKAKGMEAFYQTVLSVVAKSAESNTEIQGSVDMNAFQAMLYEYALRYPEMAHDEENYSDDDAAKNRIDAFLADKFSGLAKMAAPLLLFDSRDMYSGLFVDKDGNREEERVSNFYRYLSYNSEVEASIRKLVPSRGAGAVSSFYGDLAQDLPKDTDSQTIAINLVQSERVDSHSILCYAIANCLQPYQINSFDELKGGVYYTHYAARIAEMERKQKYSMTPHLDKRWHKHGVMPYINAAKELDRRHDLAKAFLYALCYGMIAYTVDGADAYLVYGDSKIKRSTEKIYYKGKPIPYNKINRGINWLADQEDLIERYSSLFDQAVEAEVEKLSKYSDNVGKYKTAITNYGRILGQMKRNIIRAESVVASKNGRVKKLEKKDDISILELAWKLHTSEETEIDKDHAELLVSMLCDTIKKYAKGPYNSRDIAKKNEGSASYTNYLDVLNHIAAGFLNTFAGAIGKKIKEDLEIDSAAAEAADVTSDKKTSKAFGVDYSDLTDSEVEVASDDNVVVSENLRRDESYKWAKAEIEKGLKD